MNLQHISFYSTDRLLLSGLMFSSTKPPQSVALFLHGNGSASVFQSVKKMNAYAKALTNKSIDFLAFDNRGAMRVRTIKQYDNDGNIVARIKAGTAFEEIRDCVHDIDGAVSYVQSLGYTNLYLIGESTGANKICVYNVYKNKTPFKKYVLVAAGDDTGIYYSMLGEKKFWQGLNKSKIMIEKGRGTDLVPKYIIGNEIMSYQSLFDTINPDGDYNVFPYYEVLFNKCLSTKPYFRYFQSIRIPTLVMYGDKDEFAYDKVPEIISILKSFQEHEVDYDITVNADHGFTDYLEPITEKISMWLIRSGMK